MSATGTRFQAIEIGADIGAGQVQHLAVEPLVLLDLRLGFRRSAGKFAVRLQASATQRTGFIDESLGDLPLRTPAG